MSKQINKNKKKFEAELKKAQDFLEPYITMAIYFGEDSEETDSEIATWAMLAASIKVVKPTLSIEELLPQNIEKTMNEIGINEDFMPEDFDRLLNEQSYI